MDFEQHTLLVRRSVRLIAKQGYIESEPKTAKSKRTIKLPQFMLEALKQQLAKQLEGRLQAGTAWANRDLVFCSSEGGISLQ